MRLIARPKTAIPQACAAQAHGVSLQLRQSNQAVLHRIQAKLAIGAVNDPLEHEADQAADKVMRMAEPNPLRMSRKPETRAPQTIQPQYAGAEAPAGVEATLRAPGQPLSPMLRSFFEPRFGADFSAVRIHHDSQAGASAQAAGARAYAAGAHVAFAPGTYDPAGTAGRRLLAHELAHVMQQNAGHAPALRRTPGPLPSALDQYPEAERKSLVMVANPIPAADIAALYAPPTGGIKRSLTPSPTTEFAFGAGIAAALQPNLIQVAAFLTGQVTPPLSPGQTISVAVAPIGMVMRFSRIAHETPVRDVVLIEQNGPIPPAVPAAASPPAQSAPAGPAGAPAPAAAAAGKFAARSYNFDASLTSPAEQTAVRQAVEAIPDSALRDGLVFARASGAVGPGGEAGRYEPTGMIVRLWDNAFRQSATRSGLANETTQVIAHELGHAADRKPLDAAIATNTASPSAANERKELAARTMSGLREQKTGNVFTETEAVKDLTGAFRTAAVKDGVAVDTTTPPRVTSVGSTATLKGAPTDYGNTGWVELFADSFSMFVADPNLLHSIRPNISAFMTKNFP
jgi:hypothetical protein